MEILAGYLSLLWWLLLTLKPCSFMLFETLSCIVFFYLRHFNYKLINMLLFILCIFWISCVCFPLVVCGGTLNATMTIQTLTSPSFPNAYPPYTSCRWILDAPAQETIKVSVQTFVLQPSQSCTTNYLELKDWPVVSLDMDLTKNCCIISNKYCGKYDTRAVLWLGQ